MVLSERIKPWLVPPILVPVLSGSLLVAISVTRW
jgi:hypothetical protein